MHNNFLFYTVVAKRNLLPLLSTFTTYRKVTAEDFCIAKRFRVNFFQWHPPQVLQCPLHFFTCAPVAENILPL